MPAKVNAEDCTACESCIEVCPTEAIELKDDIAVVDDDVCSDCAVCEDACPTGAISMD